MNKVLTLGLVSLAGGTGRSTLVAEFGRSLAERGFNVALIELDPSNSLGGLMDHGHARSQGMASGLIPVTTTQGHLVYLPHDVLAIREAAGMRPDRVVSDLRSDPALLHHPLDFILLDVARGPDPSMEQALALADRIIHVLTPVHRGLEDARRLAAWPQIERNASRLVHLINRLDGRRLLDRDLLRIFKESLGDRLMNEMVHEDQAVPESQARGLTLSAHAPKSQAHRDIQGLVNWIVACRRSLT